MTDDIGKKFELRMKALRLNRQNKGQAMQQQQNSATEAEKAKLTHLYNTLPHTRRAERKLNKTLTPEQYLEYIKHKPKPKTAITAATTTTTTTTTISTTTTTTPTQNSKQKKKKRTKNATTTTTTTTTTPMTTDVLNLAQRPLFTLPLSTSSSIII